MFTGIVHGRGEIVRIERARGGDVRLEVRCAVLGRPLAVGDSVAVNGVCLTALEPDPERFRCDVSRETLDCTTLGGLAEGDRVYRSYPGDAGR